MENVYANFNTDLGVIEDIQAKISSKIAKLVNKQNSYRKYDFNLIFDNNDILKLQTYNEILEGIKKCNSCYDDMEIPSIIAKINAILNKI